MAQGTDRRQMNVRLPNDLYQRADAHRKALGMSRDAWTRMVIENILNDDEAYAECFGTLPAVTPITKHAPHALYRFFDEYDELLYIGVTLNPSRRWPDHSRAKPWWMEVDTITVTNYPDRETVISAEQDAIKTEHPRYNTTHNGAWKVTSNGTHSR